MKLRTIFIKMKKVNLLSLLMVMLFSMHTAFAQYNQNDKYAKGKFEKVLIKQSNFTTKTTIYQADAKKLASEWNGSGFSLITKKGNTNYSTGKYAANANIVVFGPSITLPVVSGKERIILQLDEQFKTETEYDYISVWASTDGGKTGTWVYRKSGKSGGAVTDYADLTHLAGKTVQLSLQFSADGTEQSDGWDISSISLYTAEKAVTSGSSSFLKSMLKSGGDTTLQIISINSDNFPDTLYIKFTVTDADSNFVDNLTFNDLKIFDDYEERSSCLYLQKKIEVMSPPLDIVFLVDNSGSMSDNQAKVEANIHSLLDTMAGRYDVQLGLFRFGQSTIQNECPDYAVEEIADSQQNKVLKRIYNTSDVTKFMDSVWSKNEASGAYEPYYEVLNWASVQSLNYRPEAQKVFIIIGDEEVNDGYNNTDCNGNASTLTQTSTSAQLAAENIQTFCIVSNSFVSQFSTIASETGGSTEDIDANTYADLLEHIAEKMTGSYTLRYCLDTINTDSIRLVNLSLASDSTVFDTITYTVKDVPYLVRTDATIAVSETAQIRKQSVTVAATLYTDYPDSVESLSVCYKQYYANSFTCATASVVSTGVDSVVYSYTIPAAAVDSPLVYYYFTATLLNQTIIQFSPAEEEAYDAWTIPVLPNYPPRIDQVTFNPGVDFLTPCSPVTICAHVTDSTRYLDEVILYYKIKGTLSVYNVLAMDSCSNCGGSDWYCATIPKEAATENGIAYYILAKDNFGTQSWYGTPEYTRSLTFDYAELSDTLPMTITLQGVSNAYMCTAMRSSDTVWSYFTNKCLDLQKGWFGVLDTATSSVQITVYGDSDDTDGYKNGFDYGETVDLKLIRNGFDIFLGHTAITYQAGTSVTVGTVAGVYTAIMEITGNDETIYPGTTTTSTSDDTNFGTCSSATTHTFTINNIGCFRNMIVDSIRISNTANFSLGANYTGLSIVAGGTYDFDVTFEAIEDATATVSVYNQTSTEKYTFAVNGFVANALSPCDGVSISPNPLESWGGIADVTIDTQCTLSIYIYDINGNYVANVYGPTTTSVGIHSFYIDPSNLSNNNTYILVVDKGSEICGSQFTKQ